MPRESSTRLGGTWSFRERRCCSRCWRSTWSATACWTPSTRAGSRDDAAVASGKRLPRVQRNRRTHPMRVSRSLIASLAVTGLLAVGITACGSSGSKSSASGGGSSSQSSSNNSNGASNGVQQIPLKPGENPVGQTLTGPTKKRGGTLTVYSSEDFEHLDPGESYFTQD